MNASISSEILSRYAADAAREVPGVRALTRRRSVRVAGEGEGVRVEVHVTVEWRASIPELAGEIQARVREYLKRMADLEPAEVNVIVDEIGPRT